MADSENTPQTQPQQDQQAEAAEPAIQRQIVAENVSGTVKWFNVKKGYGFITRNDTKEDVFVHQTAIVRNNPNKAVRSVDNGEEVEFDVVVGDKGLVADGVTGPGGEPVKGSSYAPNKRWINLQQYYPRVYTHVFGGEGAPRRGRGGGRRGQGGPRRGMGRRGACAQAGAHPEYGQYAYGRPPPWRSYLSRIFRSRTRNNYMRGGRKLGAGGTRPAWSRSETPSPASSP